MTHISSTPRRAFLKTAASLAALAMTPRIINASQPVATTGDRAGNGFTFLFQGDSITDGNRTRNDDWNHVMGHGYQYIIASKLWYDLPKKGFHFFNRGVSGNKITDLESRWQKDTIELKPDLLSILIGINDVSALLNGDSDFNAEQYESKYKSLLDQTKLALPAIQLVLCEPFILPVGKVTGNWEQYNTEVRKRAAIVQRLSNDYKTVFVSFQQAFDKALTRAPADYWIWDGIHPMPAGHELMAKEWLKETRKKLPFIR